MAKINNEEFINQICSETINSLDTYSRSIIKNHNDENIFLDKLFSISNLYINIQDASDAKEILIGFTDYFHFMAQGISQAVIREKYETAIVINKAIEIEKELCIKLVKKFGKQMQDDINLIEKKIRNYYKV